MALKKFAQALLISASFTALAACSSTGANAKDNGADVSSANNNGDQVITSGLGDGNGLSNPNAMIPGANQVYYFDFNSNVVHNSDLPSLKVQAKYLNTHSAARAQLQGNTDIRGSREYNIALGWRRANAVKDVLTLQGVNSNQLSTISYGAERPAAKGNTEADYAKNRRVNMVYTAK